MWPRERRTLGSSLSRSEQRMIIRRIRAMEPGEEPTERKENRRRVQRSTCNNSDKHSAEIRIERNEDQKDGETGFKQLRQIFPRSPTL